MLTREEDVLAAAQDPGAKPGASVAIATVVETWGSAPRPVGSHLVIDGDGNFLGSVSGGCVEGAVVEEAVDVIASGAPRMLEFGVADETAWRVGLSCGGRIKVYVERLDLMRLDVLKAMNAARASGAPASWSPSCRRRSSASSRPSGLAPIRSADAIGGRPAHGQERAGRARGRGLLPDRAGPVACA